MPQKVVVTDEKGVRHVFPEGTTPEQAAEAMGVTVNAPADAKPKPSPPAGIDPSLARAAARAGAASGGGGTIPMDIPWKEQLKAAATDLALGMSAVPFANAALAPSAGLRLLGAARAAKDVAVPLAVGTGVYHSAKSLGAPEWLAADLSAAGGFAGGGRGLIRRLLSKPGAAAEGALSAEGQALATAERGATSGVPAAGIRPTPSSGSLVSTRVMPAQTGTGLPRPGAMLEDIRGNAIRPMGGMLSNPDEVIPSSIPPNTGGVITPLERAQLAARFREGTARRLTEDLRKKLRGGS